MKSKVLYDAAGLILYLVFDNFFCEATCHHFAKDLFFALSLSGKLSTSVTKPGNVVLQS